LLFLMFITQNSPVTDSSPHAEGQSTRALK
jgi:hypothetical protein